MLFTIAALTVSGYVGNKLPIPLPLKDYKIDFLSMLSWKRQVFFLGIVHFSLTKFANILGY